MTWSEEEKKLTELLEILNELKDRFGAEVIDIASKARLAVHKKWMEALSRQSQKKPFDIFRHSAFSVTSDDSGTLEYEILDDTEVRFAVKIKRCKYADFYNAKGFPEIGYAMHCAMDSGEAQAYWPGIIFKRTKTLMQGDEYCDHCYQVKG
jgi:hypothetical protein